MHHNLIFVPFEPWHVEVINLRDEQRKTTDLSIEQVGGVEQYGNIFLNFAPIVDGEVLAKTALLDGLVIYSGGLTWESFNCVTAWSLVSKEFLEAPKTVKAKVISKVKEGIDKAPVLRVQGLVDEGFEVAEDYLKRLGMEREGVLKGYAPDGSNQIIYGMVKNEQ